MLECTVFLLKKKNDPIFSFIGTYKSNVKYNKINVLRNRIVTAIGIIRYAAAHLEWKGIPTQIPLYH